MKRSLNAQSILRIGQLLTSGIAAAAQQPASAGLDEARAAFEAILRIDPLQTDALNYLAELARMRGDLAQALALSQSVFQHALAPKPEYHNTRGLTYQALADQSQSHYALALAEFESAIARQKTYAPAYSNAAHVCRLLGQADKALQLCAQARAHKALSGDLLNNIGSLYFGESDFTKARPYFEEALQHSPGNVVATDNLLKVHLLDTATNTTSIAPLLAQHPQHVIGELVLLKAVLGNLRQHQQHQHNELGIQTLERVILHSLSCPWAADAAAFYCTDEGLVITLALSSHYQNHGQVKAAYRLHEALNNAQPANPELRNNFGSMAFYFGHFEVALVQFKAAIAQNPKLAMAHLNAGVSALALGQSLAALAHFQAALVHSPSHQHTLVQLLSLYLQLGLWDDFYDHRERFTQCMQALSQQGERGHVDTQGSLQILSLSESASVQFEHQTLVSKQFFVTRDAPGSTFNAALPRKPKSKKIKIGYLSFDLRNHPVAYLTAELYGLHDRSQFEVFVYSYGPNDDSATSNYRSRIATSAEHFIDLEHVSLADTATTIYAENLDILVDLTGNTKNTRSPLLGLRLADVQAHWLGYIATSGHPCMDYIISDAFTTPPELQEAYSEKIVRLPYTLQINDRQRAIAQPSPAVTRASYGLPEHGFVFCNFGQIFKIQPRLFAAWMAILNAAPGSVLWLAEQDPLATDNLLREAAQASIAPDRLIFAQRLPIPEYLARYRLADLMLDTTPIGSGTSASDCLWAGCPLLMMAGQIMYARMCGGILLAAQLPQLITHSLDAYVQKAIELAGDPAQIAAIKTHLRSQRDTLPLFDTPRKVHQLEAAYVQMHARHAAGLAPDHITISNSFLERPLWIPNSSSTTTKS